MKAGAKLDEKDGWEGKKRTICVVIEFDYEIFQNIFSKENLPP